MGNAGVIKMSNIRDFKNKNTRFTGTDSITVPAGGTADRNGTPALGMLRYNTDLGFLEQYNAAGWAGIDAPPTVSSISGTLYNSTDATITITGSNFKSASSITVLGPGVNNVDRSVSTTFVNSGELTFASNAASVNYVAGATFNVKVTNPSGLSATLEPAGTVNSFPLWSTGSGSIGTLTNGNRGASNITTLSASDADGGSVTFALQSGTLPTGITLNSNGTWSGTANSESSNTTYNFTIRATDNEGDTADRAFSIDVLAPVVQSFTSGSGTFNVPSGVTQVEVLVVAGGGSGAGNTYHGGGGGGGGMVEAPSYPVSPGGTVSYSVGGGGPRPGNSSNGNPGGNSTFGNITAIGGGGGGNYSNGSPGLSGGSGGGGASNTGTPGGPGTQGPSGGGTGYGNPGGNGNSPSGGGGGGGGGGAGGGGTSGGAYGNNNQGGAGGPGRSNSITGAAVAYAGGGGGSSFAGAPPSPSAPGGGGFGTPGVGNNGATNTGGGGGSGERDTSSNTGIGGPGIVIVRY